MIKETIEYEDLFDGEKKTGEFFFHLSKLEILAINSSGLAGLLQQLSETNNLHELIEEFKNIILSAYGVREGDAFVKTEEARERFRGHPAFEELFIKMATDEAYAARFMVGMVPTEYAVEARSSMERAKAEVKAKHPEPPTPPTPPAVTPPAKQGPPEFTPPAQPSA